MSSPGEESAKLSRPAKVACAGLAARPAAGASAALVGGDPAGARPAPCVPGIADLGAGDDDPVARGARPERTTRRPSTTGPSSTGLGRDPAVARRRPARSCAPGRSAPRCRAPAARVSCRRSPAACCRTCPGSGNSCGLAKHRAAADRARMRIEPVVGEVELRPASDSRSRPAGGSRPAAARPPARARAAP